MKKLIVGLVSLITFSALFTACMKNDVDNTPRYQDPALEKASIDSFINAKGYNMVELKENNVGTGLMYEILNYGDTTSTGIVSNLRPIAKVKYTGTLLNGDIFDSSTNANFDMRYSQNYISSFNFAIFSIGKGGHIRFVTPSKYGYGNKASSKIPANSPLFFDVELLDVTAQ